MPLKATARHLPNEGKCHNDVLLKRLLQTQLCLKQSRDQSERIQEGERNRSHQNRQTLEKYLQAD